MSEPRMDMRPASGASSSEVSRHSSLFRSQDGPFPYLPPAAEVRANLQRQAALSSSLSMPGRANGYSDSYPIDVNQGPSNSGIPDYPYPSWMDNPNNYGYHSSHDPGMVHNDDDAFGMVRSDHDLPRGVSQNVNAGATLSDASGMNPENAVPTSTNGKKKNEGARSKFKAFLDKFPGRRRVNPATVPPVDDDAESNEGIEPFPDFYSGERGTTHCAYRTSTTGGPRNLGPRLNAPATKRYRRASWSSSARRIPRRSFLSILKSRIMKSRIVTLLTKKSAKKRGRTWEPSTRRSSNPFSPFTRRNAGVRTRTTTPDSGEMIATRVPITDTRNMF